MKVTMSWGTALSVSLTPITSVTCWLIGRQFAAGAAWPLTIAGLGGLLCLAAIMIVEHEKTSRAALPYRVEQILARAEARNRIRYAKAQTRRFARLEPSEQYSPDRATDLTAIMRGSLITPRATTASGSGVAAVIGSAPPASIDPRSKSAPPAEACAPG